MGGRTPLSSKWSPENPHRRRLRWLLNRFVYLDHLVKRQATSGAVRETVDEGAERYRYKQQFSDLKSLALRIGHGEPLDWRERMALEGLWRGLYVRIRLEIGGRLRAGGWWIRRRAGRGEMFAATHPHLREPERTQIVQAFQGRIMVRHLWKAQRIAREFMDRFAALDDQGRKDLAAEEMKRLMTRFRPRGHLEVAPLPDAVLLTVLKAMEHVPASLIRRCPCGRIFVGVKSQRHCIRHQGAVRLEQWREAQARQRKRGKTRRSQRGRRSRR